jgi:hypothetical protein
MRLKSLVKTKEAAFFPHLNTGTLLDIGNGAFISGKDNHMILNGGITFMTGISGKPQRFKTGLTISNAMGVLCRYKDSEMFYYDSENSVNSADRLLAMVEPQYMTPDLSERITILDQVDYGLSELYDHIKQIYKMKLQHEKELTVESPFIDYKTGKFRKMMIPTIYIIDSLSRTRLAKEFAKLDKHDLGDSELNTIDLDDGRQKTTFLGSIGKMAIRANIYFIITAHIGDKFDLNPMARTSKDLANMKHNDQLKGVGSQFKFLMSSLIEARDANFLQTSDKKKCLYPTSFSNTNELIESTSLTIRGKNNQSGNIMKQVISQNVGIRRGLTNYRSLRTNSNKGLIVSGQKNLFSFKWFPDLKPFMDSEARDIIEKNEKLERALEILGHMNYIKEYWALFGVDNIINDLTVNKFVDLVHKQGDNFIQDILSSRGYWTYDKDDPKEYLSLLDIITLINTGKTTKQKGK